MDEVPISDDEWAVRKLRWVLQRAMAAVQAECLRRDGWDSPWRQ